MTFSYSSGTITQTGTDADLSGLSGLTDVTTYNLGNITAYDIGQNQLDVEGALTIDPRDNFLVMNVDGNSTLTITGTLNVGVEITTDGGEIYTNGLALLHNGRSVQPWVQNIDNQGTINWYGADIQSAGGLRTLNGTLKVRNGKFLSYRSQNAPQGNQVFFEAGGVCDIIGLEKVLSNSLSAENATVGFTQAPTITNLSGIRGKGAISADNRNSVTPPIPMVRADELIADRIQGGYITAFTALVHVYNSGSWGSFTTLSLVQRASYSGGTDEKYGQIEIRRECKLRFTSNNAALSGVKSFYRDVDNGNRGVTIATAWGRDYSTDLTYSTTSNSNGESILDILEVAYYRTTPVGGGTAFFNASPDQRIPSDYRIKIPSISYPHGLASPVVLGNTLGSDFVSVPLVPDLLITEADKAVVDAYTELDGSNSNQKAYDLEKSILVDNFAGETQTTVTLTDGAFDARALDVVIDATASQVRSRTGDTITYKATTWTGDITTTGTVTTANGASVNGTITDSTGTTSPPAFLSIPNAEDGVRILAARVEAITFTASDINITSNEITLTGNNFTATSFPTLVRLNFTSDATLPISTPQIVDGGLYFVKSVSSSLVTLSTTEGGTTISFTSQGTDGASSFCTATGFTELDDSLISGGSGYSNSFSLPNNTPILVKAVHWSESGGVASASSFFQSTVSWSASAGATIVDSIGITSSPDTVHNQIASLSSIALASQVIDSNGNAVTSINPTSDGSTVPGVTIALEGVGRVEVNANDSDGILAVQDLYMFAAYFRATEDGIRIMFGGDSASVAATDIYNFVTNNVQFDNTNSSVPLSLVGAILRDGGGKSLVANMTNPIAFNVATTGTGAIIETGTSGLTSEESNILSSLDTRTLRVDELIEDDGGDRFTTKALEAGPSGGGGGDATAANQTTIINTLTNIQGAGFRASTDSLEAIRDRGDAAWITATPLDAASVRAAVGLTSANLDTQLGNIPTVTEFEARTLPTASYFNPANDTVARVTLVDTTTVNSDMRGTDGANIVVPNNAAVEAIPTNPLLSTDTRLNNLDATISSRSSHAAPDLSNLDVAVSTRSTFNAGAEAVTVGANQDKSGYSLIQAFPSNFSSLAIDGSGQVTAENMRGTDGSLTTLPGTIPAAWVSDIQNGLAIESKQDTIIANIAALSPGDATAANQSSILDVVRDISDLMGFTDGQPMTSDTSTSTITSNGKTVTVSESGTQRTYTRS